MIEVQIDLNDVKNRLDPLFLSPNDFSKFVETEKLGESKRTAEAAAIEREGG
jgi:hypothetical protein